MIRVFATGALACSTLAAPAFAADLADLPSCLKPRTLSAVTATITQASVIKDPTIAQGFRTSDPACTYQVARPLPIFQEVPIRGLW
ncbi:MAG: hypothetical protein NTW83_11630 [Cyanobacteria bacterium]|nr:hypothetical protein [Cyanobacteriota bacterium]